MHNIKLIFRTILFSLFIFSCGKKDTVETDNIFKFRDYVNYTTYGVVSVSEPIKVSLSDSVQGWEEGKIIDEDFLKISPKTEGEIKAINNHTIVFYPKEFLKPATEYTVLVNLSEANPKIPNEFKEYTFQFKTITPAFNVQTNGIQSYSKDWQYTEGLLQSADYISLEEAKKLVKANQKGKNLNIIWNQVEEKQKIFEFKIDSIQRFVEDSEIQFSWDGSPINSKNKGENIIQIPGKSNFAVIKINTFQSPEQYLSINFSDPLDSKQNFEGLVSIGSGYKAKFIADGNLLKVYPTRKLTGKVAIRVFKEIKSEDGFSLKKNIYSLENFEQSKPDVRLLSEGVIIPNSSELNFTFEAVNLKAVDLKVIEIFENNVLQFLQENEIHNNDSYNIRRVGRRIAEKRISLIENKIENTGKWKAYSVDLSKLIKTTPGSIYRIELTYKKEYSLYDCALNDGDSKDSSDDDDYYEEDYYGESDFDSSENELLREEKYWDNIIYRYKSDRYDYDQRKNPCTDSYYNYKNSSYRLVSQNIIGSNLGLIAKKGENNNYFFAVTDILSTTPEAGAVVKLFNYQQQEIASATTDEDGFVMIPSDKMAYFASATKGKSVSYIKLIDGNSNSMSKFDVSGKKLQKGLKGYIYGERGVWRPGDNIFLTLILNDNENKLPQKHPVKIQITDPVGKLVYQKITTNHLNHFYSFKIPTETNYKTGNYLAKVTVGGASFTKKLKVETIKPNRLKIKVDFDNGVLKKNESINGNLQVNWLHGAPAKNIKAEIKTKFTTSYKGFKDYNGYTFIDPSKKFKSTEDIIFEGKLDENGRVKIDSKLSVGGNAPGMLKANFLVRAFERGGDFSIDAFSIPYAPYQSFVGFRAPEKDRYGSYSTGEKYNFDVVTVDGEGKPQARNNLLVKVYKIEWRWWWNSSYDDLSRYVSDEVKTPFLEKRFSTAANGKGAFSLNVPDNERGRYLVRVTDLESGHSTGETMYFYDNWWDAPSSGDKEAAKMLVFSSDKKEYKVGEIAKVTFPSGNEGRALVSIENGTEVLSNQWVKTIKGETTVDIPITSEMAPNVFVNISLLQPHAVTSNDLPIRLYGVIPIMVNDPKTILKPVLKAPKSVRPETDYKIEVSEENNQSMTYTLAVVEEGLLDLTRFKTPNAWNEFYARQALGVKTWDIYDNVIGAYSGRLEQVFAVGGDGSAEEGKKKKANRFKPVVTYIGPFSLKSGQTKVHKLKMPNYIGSVRTMVVAGDNEKDAYGSAEKVIKVKKPLMVLASLPRKLSPKEKVILPVTVFAMENKIKNVNISLKLSNGLKVVGERSKSLSFSKPDEKMAYFELDVSDVKGINTIQVIASGSGEKSTYDLEFDVVNPNPYSSVSIEAELTANGTQTIDINTFGEKGTNSAVVEFSTLPPMDFTRRLEYLIRYPHGCVEQTTSSVFPQLFLTDIFELNFNKKKKIQENIEKGIKRLGNFQNTNGGLGYWMGERESDDWGTTYAGHFMLEAEKKGYTLPLSFKDNWIRYQQERARNWSQNFRYNSDLRQAYRLYTLALAGKPDLSSMNRLRAFKDISNEAKWRLAAAYALAGQTKASKEISSSANIEFQPNKYDYYTYGSVDRNRAMALETMILMGDSNTKDVAKLVAKRLSSKSWMSTQSTAYSLLAMGKMVIKNGGKDMDFSYSMNGKTETVKSKNAIVQVELPINFGANQLKVVNNDNNLVYIRALNSGKLPVGEEKAEQRGLTVSTIFKDLDGKVIDVSNLTQGTDFVAQIKVVNTTNENVRDVALTQIFPSGWEIVNTRFTAFGDNTYAPVSRYKDIRDDRVHFYFDLISKNSISGGNIKTFNVMLNASYLGSYYLPGSQAEAMYDNDYFVRNKGQWVTIGR